MILCPWFLRFVRRFQGPLGHQQARSETYAAWAFNHGPPIRHSFANIDSDDYESLCEHDPGQAGNQLRMLLDIG